MKLIYILPAILAVTAALKQKRIHYEDSQAVATAAVRNGKEDLAVAAYAYPQWTGQQQQQQTTWQNPLQSTNWANQPNNWANQPNNWANQPNNWGNVPNNWGNLPNNWGSQPSNWVNNWSNAPNVLHDNWGSTIGPEQQTTTTPVSVIKNEQYYGNNGDYKYEYQLGDGTHVGEEGYFTSPNKEEASLVKKGWYSYRGADNKVYTVRYWADHTGYHAYGDHLPTPPPVPAAIQAALDKQEAEKNKPIQGYPSQTPAPYPVSSTQAAPVYTQKPIYRPPTQPEAPFYENYNPSYNNLNQYYPSQSTYYQQQQQQQQPTNYVSNYV